MTEHRANAAIRCAGCCAVLLWVIGTPAEHVGGNEYRLSGVDVWGQDLAPHFQARPFCYRAVYIETAEAEAHHYAYVKAMMPV